jgi:hypothetical protein
MEGRWLHFEAGACWKALPERQVCPLLSCGVGIENLEEPLKRFHARVFSEDGMRALVSDLNGMLGPQAIAPSDLDESFKVYLPKLLKEAPTAETEAPEDEGEPPELPAFDQEAVLLKILDAVRSGQQGPEPVPSWAMAMDGWPSPECAITLRMTSITQVVRFSSEMRQSFEEEELRKAVGPLAVCVETTAAHLLPDQWYFEGSFTVAGRGVRAATAAEGS